MHPHWRLNVVGRAFAQLLGERNDLLAALQPGAEWEEKIRRTLGEQHYRAVLLLALDCRHELALRCERNLGVALKPVDMACGAHELMGGDEEGCLGRIALNAPEPVMIGELCVVRQRPTDEHLLGFVVQ